MPPQLALAACVVFVGVTLLVHHLCSKHVSPAVWISAIWMAIIGSRPVTFWFSYADSSSSAGANLDGSSLDMTIYSVLIGAGVMVLMGRRERFADWFTYNKTITIFLCWVGLSVLWSDIPLPAFKRYIKLLGMFVMVMILATEDNPVEAIKAAMKRCAYLLIPTSMLLIKYYQGYGVSFDIWSGEKMITGVTVHKNLLGQLALIIGLAFLWIYQSRLAEGFAAGKPGRLQKWEFAHDLLIGATAIRLLFMCNSKTSLVAFMFGVALFYFQGIRFVRGHTGIYLAVFAVVFGVLEVTFSIYEPIVRALGRDPGLTNRIDIWTTLLPLQPNVLLGAGHESFWTNEVQQALAAVEISEYVSESHNGYLEVYLAYGLIGLAIFLGVIVSTYRNCQYLVRNHFGYGRFAYSFLIVVLTYNMTEAAYRGLALVPLVFYLLSIDLHKREQEQPSWRTAPARPAVAQPQIAATAAAPAMPAARPLRPGQVSPRWQFKPPSVPQPQR
jgi:exopolysaccharide production protein ExoQ